MRIASSIVSLLLILACAPALAQDQLPPLSLSGVTDAIGASIALDKIPASESARYGMTVHRDSLRNTPDFESFQERALFPGDPVVTDHTSLDGQWLCIVSQRYASWVKRSVIAQGHADEVFDHAEKTPCRVITADRMRMAYPPEAPALAELQRDLGTRTPLLPDEKLSYVDAMTSLVHIGS